MHVYISQKMNIKFEMNMLPYDIIMIIIKYTCYRTILNLACVNKKFNNLYEELNKFKKNNMLECASILINNGFKIYGEFCRDLLNNICPKNIDLFCLHNSYSNINTYSNNKFSFINNINKYIKNIENENLYNDKKALCKKINSYFMDIFKNKILISDIIIIGKYELCSIVVIIYFKETYIELHLNFPDINDFMYDFWCNTMILSSIDNHNNITKNDILNVFDKNKNTNKILLSELIENENFPLKKIIKLIKEKSAVPINKNIDLKYKNINLKYGNGFTNNIIEKNNSKNYNIITNINKNLSIYHNDNDNNKNIDLKYKNINNCNCIYSKIKSNISKKYTDSIKCENDFDNNIYIFQKKFLKTELSGFRILINNKYINYKQIEWLNKNNIKIPLKYEMN